MGTCLVAQTLRGNDRNLITNTLVGFKVKSELGIVTFDNNLGGFFDGLLTISLSAVFRMTGNHLCTNATHGCGMNWQ